MAFVYAGLALFWLFSMIAAKTKSWTFMDITKPVNLTGMVVNLAVVMIFTILVDPKGHFRTENIWLVPLITGLFYLVYVVMSKRYRETWSEFFQADRWNGLVLLSSVLFAAFGVLFV